MPCDIDHLRAAQGGQRYQLAKVDEKESEVLSKQFGDGWMSNAAADLCKIMVAFGGVGQEELVLAIHQAHPHSNTVINTATVEKALATLQEKEESKWNKTN